MKGHGGRRGLVVLVVGVTLLAAPAAAEAVGEPEIDAAWVTDVTATSANLRAEINANGLLTTYRFEYVTQAAYEASGFAAAKKAPPSGSALLGSATTPLTVVQHLGGLNPVTTYRYRAVATNSGGTVTSPEHALTTQETGLVFRLPDNRGWEMVSPVDKGGDAIAAPGALFGGGAFQAAAGGGAVTYGSATSFGLPVGAPPGSQYLSQRGGSGWSTENVSAPLDSGDYGDEPDGVPYRAFAADLSRGLLFGGLACRGGLPGCPAPNAVLPGSGAPADYMAYYLRSGGAFSSLLDAADLAHSAVSPEGFEVSFAAASPDLAHVVLSSCAALTANATEVPAGPGECDPAAQNLYRWSGGGLSLLNLGPGDPTGTPGAALGAPVGAVSGDGARVYWRDTASGNLYLREGSQTYPVDESGGGSFQAASADGSVAFFTAGGHLHRFLAATKATTDVTPGGGVAGVLGISADGAYAYYQDAGGLKQWHDGATATVAPGAGAALPANYPPATGAARVSADGSRLAFLSELELTGYDNADANTGEPNSELYLYGPPPGGGASALICASCNPTGERSQGSASIPGAQVNGSTTAYRPRVLSTAGTRLFFDSTDELVVQDTNSRSDVYQWEAQGAGDCNRSPGCVNLISSGRSNGDSRFIDASADGDDVFFITDGALVSTDPGSIDLYDARVGGGFPVPETPIACIGDACQALPSPPDDPTPGTLTKNSGNPPLRYFKERDRSCLKGKVRRKGRCRSKRVLARRACRRKHGIARRECLRELRRLNRTAGRVGR